MMIRTIKLLVLVAAVLLSAFLFATSISLGSMRPAAVTSWVETAPQGFGDRHNSIPWSMRWWQGKLYVGTLRSFICWRTAIWATLLPQVPNVYPPPDADADCTASPTDLPMQAEIWRWTPETDTWERVYQSPRDVPIPGYPGKFVARDIGYRGMLVFTESNGTEALYVAGVSAREMYSPTAQLPPPRLLRTTDGVNFQSVPQDPGTFFGDLTNTGLRAGVIHNGRMYLVNGSARGEGQLIESDNPAGGNNTFRQIMPPDTLVWDATSFNGFLYVGVASQDGFSVVKTDAQGTPPYTFTTVITAGGYLTQPSSSVVSFQAYQGQLYVGTYTPAELYRINPDDSWELLIGKARPTPTGWKYPLSGLNPGFGWPFNVQIYRMHVYEGALYLGTLDTGRELTERYPNPTLDTLLRPQYGFDLYRTTDGLHYTPITTNGFGDEFQISARTFESTPYGLFFGTGSYWYGLRIWRLSPDKIYLPLILMSSRS